jgi:GH35 family endo-1,4-beta-xylanase
MDEPRPATVRWELRNWEGQPLEQGRRELELNPKAVPNPVRVSIPAELRDRWRFLEAEFHLEVVDQDVPPVQAAWVAPIEDPGDAVLRPESPFGMGAYFYRYPAHAAGYAEMSRAAAVARAAGVKWSREEFQWGRIEPRRGEFDWEFYDRMLATAREHGIQVYAIVGYWSGWTKPYTAEGIEDYVRYLEALVRRYGRAIRHWEIWNEPNIFFWQGPKDLYADLLKRSYAAVKALDPEAEVLGLSTAGIDFDYIRRMLELGAPFDILTIHPYRRTLNDQAFLEDLRQASDLVRRPDGTRRPVWLTELGWSTYSPHNTLRQDFAPTTLRTQAELIARCYLLAIVSGIDPRTFWYNFRNDGDDPFYFEHHMGIVDRQLQPKPAYRTFAVMTRRLAGLKPVGSLQLGAGTQAWRFAPAPGETAGSAVDSSSPTVTVLWNPRADEHVTVPWDAATARRVNAMGESIALSVRGGQVVVPLRRGAVVYLVE